MAALFVTLSGPIGQW